WRLRRRPSRTRRPRPSLWSRRCGRTRRRRPPSHGGSKPTTGPGCRSRRRPPVARRGRQGRRLSHEGSRSWGRTVAPAPLLLLFVFLVESAEDTCGSSEGGGDTGCSLDDRRQVVVDEGAVALQWRRAERPENGGGVPGRDDRLRIVERRRRPPQVIGPATAASTGAPAAPSAASALTLSLSRSLSLRLLRLLLAHASSSVSSESGRRPRAARS